MIGLSGCNFLISRRAYLVKIGENSQIKDKDDQEEYVSLPSTV